MDLGTWPIMETYVLSRTGKRDRKTDRKKQRKRNDETDRKKKRVGDRQPKGERQSLSRTAQSNFEEECRREVQGVSPGALFPPRERSLKLATSEL